MKSRVFRALIQSMLVAAAPLSLQAGCGTCVKTESTPLSADASLRLRMATWACEPFCGPDVTVCSVIVAGQSPLSIDCNGKPPTMSVPSRVLIDLSQDECAQLCGQQAESCALSNQDTRYPGEVVRLCSTTYSCPQTPGAIAGRRPADMQRVDCIADHEVGAFFAETCQLEAAAVTAFAILADELRAHGAPAELIAAAEQAERDEVRHTQMTTALAQRFAAVPSMPTVQRHAPRPLLAMALENVVEGCVREAFGAFVASWQGEYADDAKVRAIMARIARDEIQHAELSFAIDAWLASKLNQDERARVEQARVDAFRELSSELDRPLSPSLRSIAGLPPSTAAQAFLRAHAQQICSA